jgi:YD repeat-containing protein
MKILSGDFNVKTGRKQIFKWKNGNDSFYETSHKNRIILVGFYKSKNLIIMFPHHKIHRYTWTSAGAMTNNQTDPDGQNTTIEYI